MKRSLFYVTLIAALCICLGFAAMATFAHAETFQTSAQAAVVMEQSSRRILYSKNSDMHLPMASTTKIVTALTVLKHADLDSVVEIPSEAVGIEGSSIYLRQGEHLTVKELLLGLMLRSGNDSATALALHVAGDVASFAKLMNETAKEYGCKDSNFVNPHGLPDDDHYTSARDLAILTCAALDNSDFCEIVSSKTARISNEGMEYERVLVNKNKLLNSYLGADGVKTGYTKKAGRCFVGSATRDGMQVVTVVLNCGPMFEETAEMLDAAFDAYHMQTVVPQNKICGVRLEKGKKTYYYSPKSFSYPVVDGEDILARVDMESETPQLTITLNGNSIYTQPLTKFSGADSFR